MIEKQELLNKREQIQWIGSLFPSNFYWCNPSFHSLISLSAPKIAPTTPILRPSASENSFFPPTPKKTNHGPTPILYSRQQESPFMSLVQYSDSESDADQSASPPAKKPRHEAKAPTVSRSLALPPLPAAFHDLYASSTRVSVKDDPSLHGGRKRVIPHVEGNWPTHVYVECVCDPEPSP